MLSWSHYREHIQECWHKRQRRKRCVRWSETDADIEKGVKRGQQSGPQALTFPPGNRRAAVCVWGSAFYHREEWLFLTYFTWHEILQVHPWCHNGSTLSFLMSEGYSLVDESLTSHKALSVYLWYPVPSLRTRQLPPLAPVAPTLALPCCCTENVHCRFSSSWHMVQGRWYLTLTERLWHSLGNPVSYSMRLPKKDATCLGWAPFERMSSKSAEEMK